MPRKVRDSNLETRTTRARRASANRIWTILRATLNHAFDDGKIETDITWRKMKPFRKVDGSRNIANWSKRETALVSASANRPAPKTAVSSRATFSVSKVPRPAVIASA
jgi:hypothetical protein